MSGLFSSPSLPAPAKPVLMPDPEDKLSKARKRRGVAKKYEEGGGRQTTILSDKLGE